MERQKCFIKMLMSDKYCQTPCIIRDVWSGPTISVPQYGTFSLMTSHITLYITDWGATPAACVEARDRGAAHQGVARVTRYGGHLVVSCPCWCASQPVGRSWAFTIWLRKTNWCKWVHLFTALKSKWWMLKNHFHFILTFNANQNLFLTNEHIHLVSNI